ncbi:MAG: Fpg/Nei family DNA glycosylase [Candidatus Nanopelagicales bacterium]|nr:Fpg/Nei family DNA glycosylase [Candidatus Nanopelagicales bacterium]
MPEGHVVHSQARRLRTRFRGSPVRVDSPQGRFAADACRIDGRVVDTVEAHGKHLFIRFGDLWVHVHLGLFGKWRISPGAAPDVRGQIRLRLLNDSSYAELRGPTVCELLDDESKKAAVARIGPDPIKKSDPTPAWNRVERSNAAIGALLMDQKVFAGVGNIYRAEVLFRHNISPYRPGKHLSRNEFDAVWDDLVVLMTQGTKRGRIDTVRPEHLPDIMGRKPRQDRHGGEVYVYRRAGDACYLCEAEIEMNEMQARKVYWCPVCQPE